MKPEEFKAGQVLRREPDDGWRGVVIRSCVRRDGKEFFRYTSVTLQEKKGSPAIHLFGHIVEGLILDANAFEVDEKWVPQ